MTSRAELLTLERESLTAFVASCSHLMTGRTLDYGCGKQPYRTHVAGEYVPFDRRDLPGGTGGDVGPEMADGLSFDAVLCTQVIEYVAEPGEMLDRLYRVLRPGGHLILTGPTCWIEPPGHLHGITLAGIRLLLEDVGFDVIRLESRGHVPPDLSIGYGAVAQVRP